MPSPVLLAFFVRHGETTLNASNCFRGSLDPSLNSNGQADAEELASFFAGKDISAIFYSDKKRSTETAKAIARKKPDVPCYGTDSLWALDVGKFSGQEKTEANEKELDEYIKNPDRTIPRGESLNAFKSRVRPCIMESLEFANTAGKPTVNVVHSSVIHELGDMFNQNSTSTLVHPGGVAAVYADNGRIVARPLLKPNHTKIGSRADTVS